MQIIKPQQLIFLNGRYQIATQSYLGISVVTGFYLSKPDHFACEADIWAGWEQAPMSYRVLDLAEPKPCAEFLLAGSAHTPEAWVSIGDLSRRWRLRSDHRPSGKRGTRLALDHSLSYGGEGYAENPFGRGHKDGRYPLLMLLNNGVEQPNEPLAAPGPLSPHFTARKQWLDNVSSVMGDKKYLQTLFPGYPQALDRRYFQLAPPAQRLAQGEWPDDIVYELAGFLPDSGVIRGTMPRVRARAFYSDKYNAQQLSVLPLERKTLWLLPDCDLGLMVFTGQLALDYLTAQPLDTLALALDSLDTPRGEAYFRTIIARRQTKCDGEFGAFYDPDLMPPEMTMNAIYAKEHNPMSLHYLPGVRHGSMAHYQTLRQKVQEHLRKNHRQEAMQPEKIDWKAFPCTDRYTLTQLADEKQPAVIEGEIFTDQSMAGKSLENMTFRQCQFVGCRLSDIALENCQFEFCHFEECHFSDSRFARCTLNKSRFTDSHFTNTSLQKCMLEQVNFSVLLASQLHSQNSVWRGCQFDSCDLDKAVFTGDEMESCSFVNCQLCGMRCLAVKLTGFVFQQCNMAAASFQQGDLQRGSLLACECARMEWRECQLKSTTLQNDCGLESTTFTECLLGQIGFRGVDLSASVFTCCTLSETSFESARVSSGRFIRCEMAGCNLKDAILCKSLWEKTSLQQAVLHHADLRHARFDNCNLVGANLAMVVRNAHCSFSNCLLEKTIWHPVYPLKESEKSDEEQ